MGRGGSRARDWADGARKWREDNRHLMEVDPIAGRHFFSSKLVICIVDDFNSLYQAGRKPEYQ
eukprot:4415862-Lingulodinium_polyedra.AAC.1